jgi:hypothetical protein
MLLLEEIRLFLDPEDDEDDEGLIEDENDADEKEIALALRGMVLELKACGNDVCGLSHSYLSLKADTFRDFLVDRNT